MFIIPTTAHYCAQRASADPLNEWSSQHAGPIDRARNLNLRTGSS